MAIFFNGEAITYQEARVLVLVARFHGAPDGAPLTWRKEFAVDLDPDHRVWGWAALRVRASLSEAGFAVFRRDRLILGSFDETYRPETIFRKPNSYIYQRLFGEMFVDGFRVSHTKDGLQWDDWEELILQDLRKQLDADPLRLLDQAEGYRHVKLHHLPSDWGRKAVDAAATAAGQHAPPVVASQLGQPPEQEAAPEHLRDTPLRASRSFELNVEEAMRLWLVSLELADHLEPAVRPYARASPVAVLPTGTSGPCNRFSRHRDLRVLNRYDDNRQDLGGEVARLVAAEV